MRRWPRWANASGGALGTYGRRDVWTRERAAGVAEDVILEEALQLSYCTLVLSAYVFLLP